MQAKNRVDTSNEQKLIGAYFYRHRKEQGLTQADVAKRSNGMFSLSWVSYFENGTCDSSFIMVYTYAKVLNIPIPTSLWLTGLTFRSASVEDEWDTEDLVTESTEEENEHWSPSDILRDEAEQLFMRPWYDRREVNDLLDMALKFKQLGL